MPKAENENNSTIEYLRQKAALLPKTPGVYIMQDKNGKVIYVGKSRALKNRVSQYFHGSHDLKTTRMASSVADFRFITCDTEMEALVLENNLIKEYTPKYNILLKDAKSYPYIKITDELYPRIVMSRKRSEKGTFFGPYSGIGSIYDIISTIEKTLGIPSCKRKFPEDIGKSRPCVYKQIGRCCGVCTGEISPEEYAEIIKCAKNLLNGKSEDVRAQLSNRMIEAAESERFEEAARCRDALAALDKLTFKQKTQLSPNEECDIIALETHEGCDCAAFIYIRGGAVIDSEYFMFGADEITGAENEDEEAPIISFIVDLYKKRESVPKEIWLSFDIADEDKATLTEYFRTVYGKKVNIRTPKKGEAYKLCEMAKRDAVSHSRTRRKQGETEERVLVNLASLLGLEVIPERIEAYDISNLGDEHITAGMITIENTKFKRDDYRVFRMKSVNTADDYASMRETLTRRFSHVNDEGSSFSKIPDLILLDGGMTHVGVAKKLFEELGIDVPVFGMVKDNHHKTRTIVTESEEVSISREAEVFRFIYKIQEEVHRFTVSRMSEAKNKTLKKSSLENILGIGPSKAKKLLAHFTTITNLKNASLEEIEAVNGISKENADAVFKYFHSKG